MPLFFSLMSLVVDGGNILVHKRNIQVAADAAALAVAQSVNLTTSPASCVSACSDQGKAYAKKNGVNVDSSWQACDAGHTTNCWTYPYVDKSGVTHYDQVEVRLTSHVTTFIAGMIGLFGADVSARAVASTNPVTGTTTSPDSTIHGTTVINPGSTNVTTDPDQLSGGSGVAFTMSRVCNSISYGGAGSGTWDDAIKAGLPGSASVLGAFATNGGVDFSGNAPKKMTWLAFDQPRCGPQGFPDSPPSGDPTKCFARAWNTPAGSGTDSNNNCVQTLANLRGPATWPIAPPTVPTPQTGPFVPASYPSKCSDVTSQQKNGTVNVDVGDLATWPAGIYCVTGGTSFQISGAEPATSDGHSFFALGGGTISVSSNSAILKYYWPASCGPRPQPTDPRKGCVSGYDPYTLMYATFASANGNCAVCLQGQNGNMTGDIFATKPDVFPPIPTLTQTGGIVKVAGGGLSAGVGFIECWNLSITGNTGTYKGTGASIVIPGGTHTTTDPDTTTITPDTIISGTVGVTTIGTNLDLNE